MGRPVDAAHRLLQPTIRPSSLSQELATRLTPARSGIIARLAPGGSPLFARPCCWRWRPATGSCGRDGRAPSPSRRNTSPPRPVVQPFQQVGQRPTFARRSLLLPDQRGPGSSGGSHWPAPLRRENGDSRLRGRGGHNPPPGGRNGSSGGLREALARAMTGGGAPGRRRAGIPSGLHFSAERRGGPTYHSDVASDGAGRSQGGVGDGAGHARLCEPFDHTGAARHANHRGAIAANGAAQPPVVGEGRGRQAGAGPVVSSGWSQASWSMLRGPIACLFCCSRAVPTPRAPLRSVGP